MNYRLLPPDEMLVARVSLPLSKSLSNRLLIIDALTPGNNPLPTLADCDDTHNLEAALATDSREINVGDTGTAMRFLTALYAATPGSDKVIDGSERMRKRPIGGLVDALRSLGAEISYLGEEGYPPLAIKGKRLKGGKMDVDSTISSQYISALLMVAPTMENRLEINLGGEPVSLPYIKMTLAMMAERGIDCEMYAYTVTVNPGTYHHLDTTIEGDWSAAAFWYEMEAVSSGCITLDGLEKDSIQGDSFAAKLFEDFGVVTEYEGEEGGVDLIPSPELSPRLVYDMGGTPDLVPAVAVCASLLGVPFHISGISSLRVKECDRVAALIEELEKIGILAEWEKDTLVWEGRRKPIGEMPRFSSHGDHRMAMALAPVSIFIPGIVICDAEVVDKSYPGYWDQLREAGFRLLDGDEPFTDNEEEEE